MICKLITTCSDRSKIKTLEASLIKHGWPYDIIEHPWRGFGDKILKTYEYLRAHPEITHFFYSDSYDTIVTGTMEEALSRITDFECILMSAERGCYPHPEKESRYPKHESPWHFVNGGGWFCHSELFCEMVDRNQLTYNTVDQVWFTELFLNNPDKVLLDYNCEIFQTIAFCPASDFKITDRVLNTVTKSFPIFIHGNGHTPLTPFLKTLYTMNTLDELQAQWKDTPESHKAIHDLFTDKVNETQKLKELRDYIDKNIFGFGERSFYWLFKLLLDTQKPTVSFLEIGVFRGQILALVQILKPKADITGITPLDSTDGHWDSDYAADIKKLHTDFKLKQPKIIKGLSTDEAVIAEAGKQSYDLLYIDGGHTYDVAKSDVYKYSSLVKIGGYLIIDDCCNKYRIPDGMFPGIAPVSKAVDELLPNAYYEEICSVVHIRVFKRVK